MTDMLSVVIVFVVGLTLGFVGMRIWARMEQEKQVVLRARHDAWLERLRSSRAH